MNTWIFYLNLYDVKNVNIYIIIMYIMIDEIKQFITKKDVTKAYESTMLNIKHFMILKNV